jgi:hypothetical protein
MNLIKMIMRRGFEKKEKEGDKINYKAKFINTQT